ncbi:WG repeat-containing protein [Apibacter raozihei]|uniref:WG repeat-containing protein n=1 Tax=Apibacter raozihei TaxID=2500547 RepID=UPI000FE32C20|nr:WG repeat-containing protein [Apibacter raozihei]
MKNCCFILFFLFFSSYSFSLDLYEKDKEKKEKKEKKRTHSTGLSIKKQKGKYGVIDEKKQQIIIPFLFDKIEPIHEDGFATMKEKKWTIYDTRGELISSSYSFAHINIPSNVDSDPKILIIGKPYKNSTAVTVFIKNGQDIEIKNYEKILSVNPQYYSVYNNGKTGTLSIEGKETIPVIYKYITYLKSSKGEDTYKAKVTNEYTGIINVYTGEIIVSVEWEDVQILTSHLFKVLRKGKWGIIDREGKEVIPVQYKQVDLLSPRFIRVKNDAELFFVTLDSSSKKQNSDSLAFDALSIAQQNMKYGITDANQTPLTAFRYDYITKTPQQVFIATRNKKYFLLNSEGKEITPEYKSIEYNELTQNFLVQNLKNKWCLVNFQGEQILETKLSDKDKLFEELMDRTYQSSTQKSKRNRVNIGEVFESVLVGIGAFLWVIINAALYLIVSLTELDYM